MQYLLGIALFALYNRPAYVALISVTFVITHSLSSFLGSFIAGLIQLLPLFLVYPLMKRITHLPQAWLGICMNFGLIVAWAAVTGGFDVRLLAVLMVGSWGWTMHYGKFGSSSIKTLHFVFMISDTAPTYTCRHDIRMPRQARRREGRSQIDGDSAW